MPTDSLSTALRDVVAPPAPPGTTCLAEFALHLDFSPPTTILRARGDLDAHTAPTLRAVLDALAEQGHHTIVLDLAALTFMSASGLGVIAGTAARLRQMGGTLTLRSPSAQTRRILDITGIRVDVPIQGTEGLDLQSDLARVAWRPTHNDSVDAKLQSVAALASVAVEGADGVSVTLARHGRYSTVAASNDTVVRMDDHQYSTGEGPCLSAAHQGTGFEIESLADERRWPAFVPQAIEEGIASILSTPLMTADRPIGALNIYSSTARAFGSHQRELAMVFAAHAAEIASGVTEEITDDEMDARIAVALRSRSLVALAQGVLMARMRLTPDEAEAVLHRSARGAGTSTLAHAETVLASTRDLGTIEEIGRG